MGIRNDEYGILISYFVLNQFSNGLCLFDYLNYVQAGFIWGVLG